MTPDEFNKAVRAEAERVLATYKAEANKLIADSVAAALHASLQSMKADLLELSTNFGKVKETLATGKGLQNATLAITQDDMRRLAPARIQAASLSEIVELTEGK